MKLDYDRIRHVNRFFDHGDDLYTTRSELARREKAVNGALKRYDQYIEGERTKEHLTWQQYAKYLQKHPGSTVEEIAAGTGWSPGTVQGHLRLFCARGVLRRDRDGRKKYRHYAITKG